MKKYLGFFAVLVAVALVWYSLRAYREPFVPEFLDQGNVKQTAKKMQSSYAQETNHFPKSPDNLPPPTGTVTPFRVNMFNSYMV